MISDLRSDAIDIFNKAVCAVLPDRAVRQTIADMELPDKVILVSIGKAAWGMAKAASYALQGRIARGAVITKYGHSKGPIDGIEIFEAGHPIPDKNGVVAAKRVLELTEDLNACDCVLFLLSGGGSALFEMPAEGIAIEYIAEINRQLLSCGADINEINAVRKRLSSVKGGRFAIHCLPAEIRQIVLSDVPGDRLDIIASGPAAPDASTSADAAAVLGKYNISVPGEIRMILAADTPSSLNNVTTRVIGNVNGLCTAAASEAKKRGYKTSVLTTTLNCEARKAGEMLAVLAQEIKSGKSIYSPPCALIMGGETVVKLSGSAGMGGRNQELVLAAAEKIEGLDDIVIFSAGSDGTDGPTDAAGGIADGLTWRRLRDLGANPALMLEYNDSYNAFKLCGGLVKTGPTGTNVNDLTMLLCR